MFTNNCSDNKLPLNCDFDRQSTCCNSTGEDIVHCSANHDSRDTENVDNISETAQDDDIVDNSCKIDPSTSVKNGTSFTELLVNKCKCISTNADQLRNKMNELEILIDDINPDFIFITEVLPKLNIDNISCSSMLYSIDGYTAFPSSDLGRGVT